MCAVVSTVAQYLHAVDCARPSTLATGRLSYNRLKSEPSLCREEPATHRRAPPCLVIYIGPTASTNAAQGSPSACPKWARRSRVSFCRHRVPHKCTSSVYSKQSSRQWEACPAPAGLCEPVVWPVRLPCCSTPLPVELEAVRVPSRAPLGSERNAAALLFTGGLLSQGPAVAPPLSRLHPAAFLSCRPCALRRP